MLSGHQNDALAETPLASRMDLAKTRKTQTQTGEKQELNILTYSGSPYTTSERFDATFCDQAC